MASLLFVTAITVLVGADSTAVSAFIDRTRAVRSDIRSYHLVVRRVVRIGGEFRSPPRDVSETAVFEVWKQGDRTRTDFRKLGSDPPAVDDGHRSVVCRNCIRPGYAAHAGINPGGGYFMSVTFHKLDAQYDREDEFRIDWKGIGLLNGPSADYRTEPADATLLLFHKLSGVRVEPARVGTAAVDQLVGSTPSGKTTLRYAVRPDLGGNPVVIEQFSPTDKFTARTSIDYAKAAGTDIWFPTAVRYNRSMGGKTILDEVLTFETVEINQPIPESVFTLAGFGLQKNTPIEYPEIKRDGDQPLWDGEKVDPTRNARQMVTEAYRADLKGQVPVPDTPEPGRHLPYYLGGGLLAVVGGVLVARAVRRRTARA